MSGHDNEQPLGEYPPIGGIAILAEGITSMEYEEPCGTPAQHCEQPATAAVWCAHHGLGCDYSGFRCETHRKLLQDEIQHYIDEANAGKQTICGSCKQQTAGGLISDHFRWVRL